MTTIPADLFIASNPSVLAAGGSSLDLNGLFLTRDTRVPIGTVGSFPDGDAVNDYFGATSRIAVAANGGVGMGSGYFGGFDTSTVKPAAMKIAQYPLTAVSAYLRGGNISALTITQLQALNGSLTVSIDATPATASVNLSGATSFTNAAQLIETDLAITGKVQGTVTATIAATVMTVSAVLTGGAPITVGSKVVGASVTAGTFVASFGTGTGGAGTYNLTQSMTEATPETMTISAPAVYFDSVSGAFVVNSATTGATSTISFGTGAMATSLLLTAATGAVLSQGAAAATPAAFMDGVVTVDRNWATFMTDFDPDLGSGFTQKLAFSAWTNGKKNRFAYASWDTQASPTTTVPATASYGYAVAQANYSGTCLLWESSDTNLAAMLCGFVASIDFSQANGRITFAWKSQTGMVPSVVTEAAAVNLGGNPQLLSDRGNGYNYYGAIATANQNFQNLQRGFVSGPFLWLDTYVNEIWLTSECQLALTVLEQQSNSIPFSASGDGLIEAALADPIAAAVNFGAIVAGVTLSSSQIAKINAMAGGKNIASTVSSQGWYLLLPPVAPNVRQSRGPRSITLFYCDGESVQSISLATVVVL